MDIAITIGAAASTPWLPVAQILVTAISAITALCAAVIAARAYGAGRKDRMAAEIDEITVGIVDAWKAEKSMERAGQGFDPFKSTENRDRLRASALAEMANVTHRSIWPAEIDFAVIEARRLIEDTDPSSDSATLEKAGKRIQQLRKTVLKGVKALERLSLPLKSGLRESSPGQASTSAMRAMRSARGSVSGQIVGRHKSIDDLKDLCNH